ncbi:hypothetical protein BKI52_02380 [marine bacterium AO1-C]|nr:hypothetical protein BKI52_02380 [marine bacterium AO1-C]
MTSSETPQNTETATSSNEPEVSTSEDATSTESKPKVEEPEKVQPLATNEQTENEPATNTSETPVETDTSVKADAETSEPEAITEEKQEDYSEYEKSDFLNLIEQLKNESDLQKVNATLNKIKPLFDEIVNLERSEALEKFIAGGGEEGDFEFKQDDTTQGFYSNYKELKSKRSQYIAQQEKQKEDNQKTKERLLEEIRALVDSEESHNSMEELKKLQEQWKAVGPVPPAQSKSLWASYNALMELYYNKRSIYFELKELDRRKNLEKKIALCERAEKLVESASVQQAIKELHELHNEYKHIGPIPREEQDKLWQRFKAASDAIYNKKREYYQELKKQKDDNLALKLALCERIEQEFSNFQSEKIADWNTKTKELLEIQKQWEEIRFIPKEKIKEVSKRFWGAFKGFFHNKNNFFKTVEQFREENLAKKVALCERAEELTSSDQTPQKIAQGLKDLQKEWKEVGPAPAKQKQAVYERFKKTCDAFFESRRQEYLNQEKEYQVNLEKKQALCVKMDALQGDDLKDKEEKFLQVYVDEWKSIGFVPKKDKKSIQKQFEASIYAIIDRIPDLAEGKKESYVNALDLMMARLSPNASKKLNMKESGIRKKIGKLENDIDTLRNNLGFFANSQKANKLKEDFEKQIEAAERELVNLRKQLKAFKKNQ